MPDLKEEKSDKRFLKIFMTVCGLQLEVCGGIQAAPISSGVQQDGDAWNYPEPWGEPTQAVENQRKSKWKCKFRLRFTLLPWQDVFLLTLQNTASNLASAIKRTIKRLPRPPQMLPHLITAWKKQETSVVADSQGWKRVALPSFPPEGVFIFDRRWCQLLQQLHLSCLHFQDSGARNYHKERKDHQNGSHGDGWRTVKKMVFFCVISVSSKRCHFTIAAMMILNNGGACWALTKTNIQNWFNTLKPPSALNAWDVQNEVGGDSHKSRGEASDTLSNKRKFRAVSTSVRRGDLTIRSQSESDHQSH